MLKCQATRADGKPCQSWPIRNSSFCFIHSPENASKRAEARRRGGLNRQTAHGGDAGNVPARIRSLTDVLELLDYSRAEIMALENGVNRGRLLLALAAEYRQSIQVGEMEARIAALEAAQDVS